MVVLSFQDVGVQGRIEINQPLTICLHIFTYKIAKHNDKGNFFRIVSAPPW